MTHSELLRAFLNATIEDLGQRPVRAWSQWLAGPTVIGLVVAGCGGDTSGADSSGGAGEGNCTGEACAEQCRDDLDNDGDGRVDCSDQNCSNDPSCWVGTGGVGPGTGGLAWGGSPVYGIPYPVLDTETDCTNAVDDDQDGKIDCSDEDCSGNPNCGAVPTYGIPMPETDCTNNVDDDADGMVDCADDDCFYTTWCGSMADYMAPIPIENCTNQIDDDADGMVDCLDLDDCGDLPECQAARYAAPM